MPAYPQTAALHVDLSALRDNYRQLKDRHARKTIGAVVKANAYGLGVEAVSRALWDEGCREFFVATLEEAIDVRAIVPQAYIGVFAGVFAGEEKAFIAHNLLPALNTLDMLERWKAAGQRAQIIHVDSGMTRLGLNASEWARAGELAAGDGPLIMSHLACADEPGHVQNAQQLASFKAALAYFPQSRASLANSAGLFLPPDFHFDLGRPGCALYGINPGEGVNPMRHVATLSAPILQLRTLEADASVGYDATYAAPKGARIATVGIGYADGYFRSLSNLGTAYIEGVRVPVVGRVSMDMVTLDVSAVPSVGEHSRAEFICHQQPVDDVAASAATIGYEIFTRLGRRVRRIYS